VKRINQLVARIVFAGLFFGLLLYSSTTAANAATITVNTLNDEAGTGANCSLREAITAANNEISFGGCNAGSGIDTIVFGVTGAIQLNSQLPAIASSMNIVNESGPGSLTVRRNTDPNYQIFLVLNAPIVVRIAGLTIANGRSPAGAGIQNAAKLTVSNCIIAGNTAVQFAGGGIYNVGTLTLLNSTISGNTATPMSGNGGAGIENAGRLSVSNSTISGNRLIAAGSNCAGGLTSNGSLPVTITDSTVTDNEATGGTCASGIRQNTGTLTISNTIVAGNRNNSSVPDVRGAFTSSGSNLIGTSPFGTGLTNGVKGDQVGTTVAPLDPMLGPLQENGGPTPTHALLGASTAVDAGDNSLAVDPATGVPLSDDQRGLGFTRIINKSVDIGAFEVQELPNTAPVIISMSVTAQQGATASNRQIATITDNEDAPENLTFSIDGGSSASVNGVTVSNIAIDTAGKVTADIRAACSGAEATFTLRVSDGGGLYSEDTFSVIVTPSFSPILSLKPSMTFFPPNHKYTTISLDQMVGGVTDDCDANLQSAVTIDKVTSDEVDNNDRDSDGNTTDDIAFADDCSGVLLRVERDDQGNGRVYTITLKVTDSSGNTSRSDFKAFVPVSKKSQATEGPPANTVKSACK
jgi:CSLREA domain-containing protein